MDVEKTIEFLLRDRARADARFDAKFDRADERLRKLERVVAQNNRIVTRLARYGVSLRSDIRRLTREVHAEIDRLTQAQAATDRQLRAFIQSTMRRNGGR